MRERLVSPNLISKEEETFNRSLRPPTLDEYVGQKKVVEKLEIALQAARKRANRSNTVFYGPPGLGKTTLAWRSPTRWARRSPPRRDRRSRRTGDLWEFSPTSAKATSYSLTRFTASRQH